jgi:hypothetical protein
MKITYDQVVYRVPVRYRDQPGLLFLGSDAGNALMVAAGAAFSMFDVRLSKTQITDAVDGSLWTSSGHAPSTSTPLEGLAGSPCLARGVGVVSKSEAQSFLVDRFVAFVPGAEGGPMRRVRERRGTWTVHLSSVIDVGSDILQEGRALR